MIFEFQDFPNYMRDFFVV